MTRKDLDKLLKESQAALLGTDALRRPELGEMLARRYGSGCLEVIWRVANDESVDAAIRVVAAKSLWEMGYGKAATVIRLPDANHPASLDLEIAKAEAASEALGELEYWGNVAPSEWPEHVRKLVGIPDSPDAPPSQALLPPTPPE